MKLKEIIDIMNPPEQPPAIVLKLHSLGKIKSMRVFDKHTSSEYDSQECVELKGFNGKKCTVSTSTARRYLSTVLVGGTVARLSVGYQRMADDWMKYLATYKEEYAEYERLKKKFGG